MGRRNYEREFRNAHNEHDDRCADAGRLKNKGHIKDRLGKKDRYQKDPKVGSILSRIGGGSVVKRRGGAVNFQVNLDNDIDDMVTRRDKQNYRPNGKGRSKLRVVDTFHPRKLNNNTWHMITVLRGAKYNKEALLKTIMGLASVKFVPICYDTKAGKATFYVDKIEAAEDIVKLNKQIKMEDEHVLEIYNEPRMPPLATIDEELVQSIKVAMSDRYNSSTRALNLRSFYNSFPGAPIYVPLSRTNLLEKVVEIIVEHIPEVTAIDLSDNQLFSVEPFGPFIDRLQNLTILYLNNNKIGNMKSLHRLKGLKLVELKMEGNSVRTNLKDSFIDVVRVIFPSLQILDGKNLPKLISFEEEDGKLTSTQAVLPPTIKKCVKDPSAEEIVLQFLKEYFTVYDSDDRQPLLAAYSETGKMSVTVTGGYDSIKSYIDQSRNLLHVPKDYRRIKLLRKGRLPIVSALSELPKTQHDLSTFTLDIPLVTPNLLMFSVTGVFSERDTKDNHTWNFNRCFLVVPKGSGFDILNEMYHIGPEVRRHPASSPDRPPMPTNVTARLDDDAKRTLTSAFASMSGLKMEWAARCLEDNAWNYDKSAEDFMALREAGKVPADYFA